MPASRPVVRGASPAEPFAGLPDQSPVPLADAIGRDKANRCAERNGIGCHVGECAAVGGCAYRHGRSGVQGLRQCRPPAARRHQRRDLMLRRVMAAI